MRALVAATLVLAPLVAQAAVEKTRIAVMDIQAASLSPDMQQAVTAVVPQVIDQLGPFKAMTSQDIKQLLTLEMTKDRLGCDDVTCLAELGGALGARYLVTGRIIKAGDTYLVQLELLNVHEARAEGRVARDFRGSPAGLIDDLRSAVRALMRDALESRKGRLLVRVSEEGATIRVDGVIVGSSPLAAFETAHGIHSVSAEKDGFIRPVKDVEVREQQTTTLDLTLAPSEEYRRKYLAAIRVQRAWAWGGVGVGAASLVGAGALWAVAASQSKTLDGDIAAYSAKAVRTSAEASALSSRRSDVARLNSFTIGLGGVGLLALAAGTTLLATSGDPTRYGPVTSTSTGGLSLVVTPSRLGLAYAW